MRNLVQVPVILASASPRRHEILQRLGFSCRIKASGVDEESIRHSDAREQTLLLADAKCTAVAEPDLLTVAADTVVVLDDIVLEKPADKSHARQMLSSLSGRKHTVYTAVALQFPKGERVRFIEETAVFFRELPAQVIEAYCDSNEPYDKAGGYGAQDAFGMQWIRRFEGCYFNVMGFPASRFMQCLSENRRLLQG